MTKLSEEHDKNRLRTITQIMEAGERIKARGQTPWAQKLLLEELNKGEPCMKVIEEMRHLIDSIGMKITNTGEKYKAWEEQFRIIEDNMPREKKGTRMTRQIGKVGGYWIPMQLLDYFEVHPEERGEKETWEKAIEFMNRKKEALERARPGINQRFVETGVRLKGRTIETLEKLTGHKVVEWGSAIDTISTEEKITKAEIEEGATEPGQILLINGTTLTGLMNIQGAQNQKTVRMEEIMKEAMLKEMLVVIIQKGEVQEIIEQGITETTKIGDLLSLENPYGKYKIAEVPTGEREISVTVMGGKGEEGRARVMEEIMRKGERKINNMYTKKRRGELEGAWVCPLCKKEGERLN